MKEDIRCQIETFVSRYGEQETPVTKWRKPLVGFAQASDPLFKELKNVVSPTHALPKDLLANSETVMAFFIPFEKDVGQSNMDGRTASSEWARADKPPVAPVRLCARWLRSVHASGR